MKIISANEFFNSYQNFTLIIDARSPKEFKESHFEGAVNHYALDDAQHHEIGTLYKQISKFEAKKLGASYICANASEHIQNLTIAPNATIAIYCARGGLRSSSLGIILSSIGYRVSKVEHGYKGIRREVLKFLDTKPNTRFITLFGLTGSGKTKLLKELPSIDIETLANHKGSSFGGVKEQPNQKMFENTLAVELKKYENKSCFLEGESKKLGRLILPPMFYQALQNGVEIWAESSFENRVERIYQEYKNMSKDEFESSLLKIKKYISKKLYTQIQESFYGGNLKLTTSLLLKEYYDKVYKKHTTTTLRVDLDKSDCVEELKRILECN